MLRPLFMILRHSSCFSLHQTQESAEDAGRLATCFRLLLQSIHNPGRRSSDSFKYVCYQVTLGCTVQGQTSNILFVCLFSFLILSMESCSLVFLVCVCMKQAFSFRRHTRVVHVQAQVISSSSFCVTRQRYTVAE